ncbi:MAG TPA: chloride channel protein [Vicinamibacterales bacterium]|nr:chloride channel protein [Vicinamibacterales bacterium]
MTKEIEPDTANESHPATRAQTTAGLPVAPSMGPALDVVANPAEPAIVDGRTAAISGAAILIAIAAGLVARGLTAVIYFVTNLSFFGRASFGAVSPADNHLGWWIVLVPVIGGIIVGIMARFGSSAIRGHGIPEAMEQVLFNQSRIPPRVTFLKPLSAAIAIGTGGPFGAEGPIIATGGALGSVLGQYVKVTAQERKTLLAAGAAAGMAATFGTPVAAVLLAVELLLFEYRARSVVPVALASAAATAVRIAFVGADAVFPMPTLAAPTGVALTMYIILGALMGVLATLVTRAVYGIEDLFDRLPMHWMWWPAIGAIAVGVVGYFEPRTLGVGYDNITATVDGQFVGLALLTLGLLKFVSWSIALGSGTSGGTLAPLFTIGGAVGGSLAPLMARMAPFAGIDSRIAALVGMGAMFAGASRALLASVVFAFEATRQPMGLLPLLGGCTASYFISSLMMRHSIMTEKIARRGQRVLGEYSVDFLDTVLVKERVKKPAIVLQADRLVTDVRAWITSRAPGSSHQGFPVVDASGLLIGVITRRDLIDDRDQTGLKVRALIRRPPCVVFDDSSLREAADHMVRENVGRLPVVTRAHPRRVVAMITRSDLLSAHKARLIEEDRQEQALTIEIPGYVRRSARS